MIRVFNLVQEDSNVAGGWRVRIRPHPTKIDRHSGSPINNYTVELDGEEGKGIRVALDRAKYEDITIANGLNPTVPVRLYSVYLGGDKFLPVLSKEDDPKKDNTITLLNFETEKGCVISGIELDNLIVVSYYVSNKGFKTRFTTMAMSIDNSKQSSITIKHGLKEGRNLTNTIITIPQAVGADPKDKIIMENRNEVVDRITSANITLTRMDLENVCINLP